MLLPAIGCLHFVGLRDDRYWADERFQSAVRVFGEPDFVHLWWDARAKAEVGPLDVVVFAKRSGRKHQYDENNPSIMSWDDSHEDIIAHGGDNDR